MLLVKVRYSPQRDLDHRWDHTVVLLAFCGHLVALSSSRCFLDALLSF
jgi:hypothetical protein